MIQIHGKNDIKEQKKTKDKEQKTEREIFQATKLHIVMHTIC